MCVCVCVLDMVIRSWMLFLGMTHPTLARSSLGSMQGKTAYSQ